MEDMEGLFPEYGGIPRELWSEYSGTPFQECTACGRDLGSSGVYQIMKVSNGRETVFEMALCLSCGQGLGAELSEESMNALNAFITANLDLSRGEDRCSLCGTALCEGLAVSAAGVCCQGMLIMPVIRVCQGCEEREQELLSERTKRAFGEFLDRTVPGVPAGLDLAPTLLF